MNIETKSGSKSFRFKPWKLLEAARTFAHDARVPLQFVEKLEPSGSSFSANVGPALSDGARPTEGYETDSECPAKSDPDQQQPPALALYSGRSQQAIEISERLRCCSSDSRREGRKGCATKSKGGVNADEEVAAGGKPAAATKNRTPKDHVKWILAQKPLAPPPRYAALKRSNPDLTPRPGEELDEATRRLYVIAKAFYEMEEWFPREQERVREEMRTKGYVEVSDEWLRERAELNDMIDREWPKIQAKIDAIVRKQGSYCEVDKNDSESDREEEED